MARVKWLRVDRLLGEMGILKDNAAGRREFERATEARRAEANEEEWKRVRRGWCLGDETFREKLLARMDGTVSAEHFGEERKESAVAKAERITREEMGKLKWNEKTLEAKRKGDFGKIAIARRLRAETTMTHRWIAERLRMGTASHLTHLLYWEKRKKTEAK